MSGIGDEVPDFYTDQFVMSLSPYGVTCIFYLTSPEPPPPGQPPGRRELVRLRMSLEHAKVMAMLMRRQLKEYEHESGATIAIPFALYRDLDLSPDDW